MRTVAFTLALLAVACEDWKPAGEQQWRTLPAVALGSHVAFVEQTNARLFLLDPALPAAKPLMVPLARDPVLAVGRNGSAELLVLSRGERGGPDIEPVAPELAVVTTAGVARRVPLGARFDSLVQSPDGRYVIAHFGAAARPAEALFNPNEIAIVDLQPTPAVVVARTIRSFGGVPTGVVFSPRLALPGAERSLAVVLSAGYVTLLDLDNQDRTEISVPLTLPDDRRVVQPQQVLFDAKDPTVYVRANGANDVYLLRLLPVRAEERTPNGNDFSPALSQLAAGNGPSDMALFDAGEGTRLLVAAPGSAELWIIEPRTGRGTRIPAGAAVSRLFLFEAAGPGDPRTRWRALLLGGQQAAAVVGFLDLEQIEQQRTRNLDVRPMGAPAADALVLRERGVAVVLHRAGAGATGLSVVDLTRRTIAPIVAETTLAGVVVGAGAERVWIPPAQGTRLGFVRLETLQAGEVRLDAPVAQLLALAPAADRIARLVVVHPSVAGHITVVDGGKPERATARSIAGFLAHDLFDREDR